MSILVVTSDEIDARVLSYLLAQGDPHVRTAATMAQARQFIADHTWAAVVLDVALSDGSGRSLIRALNDAGYEGGILVLSSGRDVDDKVSALEEGADDYLTRPCEPAELLARVKALQRRSRRRQGSGLPWDRATVVPEAGTRQRYWIPERTTSSKMTWRAAAMTMAAGMPMTTQRGTGSEASC